MKRGPIEKFLIEKKFAKTRTSANAIMISVAIANFLISAYILKGTIVTADYSPRVEMPSNYIIENY